MNQHALVLGAVALLPLASVASFAGCATDNGANVYGDQYNPSRKLDAQADAPPVQGGHDDGGDPTDPTDAGADGDGTSLSACVGSGTTAVLAGGDLSLSGAVQVDSGSWVGGSIAGAAKSIPALSAFGAGFAAVTRGAGDALLGIPFATSFGVPAAIGTAQTLGAPALAVVAANAHVVHLAPSNKFFHATNAGAGWDNGTDPVSPSGGPQSFGPAPPAIAAAGSELVLTQTGDDGKLYQQTWSGAWAAASQVAGATPYKPAPPAMASLSGAAFDLVLLWSDDGTRRISFSARDATTKAWGAPAVVHALAVTDERAAVARAGASGLVAAFRGQDGKGYVASGTIGPSAITWAAAAPVVAGGVSVDATPAVAAGVCGDDAILVFASSGVVKATRLRAGVWSPPELVTGATGGRVAVATR